MPGWRVLRRRDERVSRSHPMLFDEEAPSPQPSPISRLMREIGEGVGSRNSQRMSECIQRGSRITTLIV